MTPARTSLLAAEAARSRGKQAAKEAMAKGLREMQVDLATAPEYKTTITDDYGHRFVSTPRANLIGMLAHLEASRS